MPSLVLINAPDKPRYRILSEEFFIGRLPDNHLPLADALVSRKHAEIRRSDDKYRLVDLNSLNGVYINNLKVHDEQLSHGDVITIGESRLLFEDSEFSSGVEWTPSAAHPSPVAAAPGVGGGGTRINAPGLAGPEIIKPIAEADPGYELEVVSIEDIMKSPGEMSTPSQADTRRSRYFFILYQVSRALNSTTSLTELLDQTLSLIFQVINAERGVIFLYGRDGELEPAVSRSRSGGELPEITVSQTITKKAIQEKAGIVTADARYDSRFQAGASIVSYNIHSALCVPLWERERTRGAIYLDNQLETYAFSEDDLDLLTAIANQVAIAVKQEEMQSRMREYAVIRSNLERFHSPDVVSHILQQSRLDDGFRKYLEEKEVTILFADICNFTPLIEKIAPDEAAQLLTDYFDAMTEIIFKYKGTVDKFIGDAIMAIFGAPISHGNDAELAVFAAVEMMKEMEKFRESVDERKRFNIRIGINTGMVTAGYLGSNQRVEYTVLGDPVNIASRLQDLARPGAILVGEETYAHVRNTFKFTDHGATRLKGKKTETGVYEVKL